MKMPPGEGKGECVKSTESYNVIRAKEIRCQTVLAHASNDDMERLCRALSQDRRL